jgi:hypothetical protein
VESFHFRRLQALLKQATVLRITNKQQTTNLPPAGTTFLAHRKNIIMASNEESNRSGIPQNNASKPMDSKKEVAQSPDEKTDEDFPGYPHYPAKEDIMDQRTGSHRVDAKLENAGTGQNDSGVSQRFPSSEEGANNKNEETGLPQKCVERRPEQIHTGNRHRRSG